MVLSTPQFIFVQIQYVIYDIISDYTIEDAAEIATAIPSDNIKWRPIDGSSLKRYDFTKSNSAIKAEFYEYYNNESYVFKLFMRDRVIDGKVYQINLKSLR